MVENAVARTAQLIQLALEELFQCCPRLFVNPTIWILKDRSEQRAAAYRVRKGHIKNFYLELPMVPKKNQIMKKFNNSQRLERK
jgi:hypothetical protein